RAIGTYASLNLLQVGLALGATLLGLYVWTGVLGRGFETPLQLPVIYVMLLYYTAVALAAIGFATFNGRLETAKSQTASLTGTVVRVAGMVAVVLFGLGAIALSWAYALGAVAAAGVVFLFLRRYPLARPTKRLVRSYVRFAYPLAIPTALGALAVTLDKTLIQLFWGVTQTGLYFTVQKVVIFLTVINAAVALLLFPSVSRFHARNDLDALRFKTGQAERYLSMIMAPVVAFLLLYPEGVIHVLLSDAFLPGATILRLFVVFTFLVALLVPRQAILQGMDRSDLYGRASLVGMVLILVLFAVLIPGLGPEGAAVSFVVGYAVILALALAFSHRVVGDRIRGRVGLHLGAALGLAVLFALLIPRATGLEWQWFHLLGAAAAFLGGYLAILSALREFRREDLRLFLDLLDPRKMARYVYGELTSKEIE
ncbi:MAG: oligosaccharide flippase family protein, partial [Thermoplasmata archaeon]